MDNKQLVFDEVGNGPAVVLVHGFPLNRRMWQPQLPALADAGFRVIAPDLPGFGESSSPRPFSMDNFADSIVSLMDSLGIAKAAICGMSMGGYILLDILERYPDRVSAAAFIATKSSADDEVGKARRTSMAADAERLGANPIIKIFAELLFAPETVRTNPELIATVTSWMRATDPKALAGGLIAMRDRKEYTPLLPQFQQPALFIGGSQDRAASPNAGEVFCTGLPHCTNRIITGAGHMVNMERPEEFNRELIAFLKEALQNA